MSLPYGTILYFGVLVLFLIPIIVAGLLGKRLPIYNAFVTLVFLYFMFSASPVQGATFIFFVFWQLALVRLYFHYRQEKKAEPRRRIRHSSDSVYSPPYYL